jgi:hypothetical protein
MDIFVNIPLNSKTFLGMTLGTGAVVWRKKTRDINSQDTVPLSLQAIKRKSDVLGLISYMVLEFKLRFAVECWHTVEWLNFAAYSQNMIRRRHLPLDLNRENWKSSLAAAAGRVPALFRCRAIILASVYLANVKNRRHLDFAPIGVKLSPKIATQHTGIQCRNILSFLLMFTRSGIYWSKKNKTVLNIFIRRRQFLPILLWSKNTFIYVLEHRITKLFFKFENC